MDCLLDELSSHQTDNRNDVERKDKISMKRKYHNSSPPRSQVDDCVTKSLLLAAEVLGRNRFNSQKSRLAALVPKVLVIIRSRILVSLHCLNSVSAFRPHGSVLEKLWHERLQRHYRTSLGPYSLCVAIVHQIVLSLLVYVLCDAGLLF